jgi:hypothetical protein
VLRLVKHLKWRLLKVAEFADLRVKRPDSRWEPVKAGRLIEFIERWVDKLARRASLERAGGLPSREPCHTRSNWLSPDWAGEWLIVDEASHTYQ